MIYNNNVLFSEIRPIWSEIAREIPNASMRIGSPKVEAKRGAEAYENAFNGFLPFVILGNEKIREEETLLQNMGTLATDPQVNQKKISRFLDTTSPSKMNGKQLKTAVKIHTTQGAILNDSNWWLFRNDMFVLGSIHSGKEFHLASKAGKEPSDDLLWDAEHNRPRVLGRELIMLAAAGYQKAEQTTYRKKGRVTPLNLEHAFFLPEGKQTTELMLSACRKKFAEIKSAAEIRTLFDRK